MNNATHSDLIILKWETTIDLMTHGYFGKEDAKWIQDKSKEIERYDYNQTKSKHHGVLLNFFVVLKNYRIQKYEMVGYFKTYSSADSYKTAIDRKVIEDNLDYDKALDGRWLRD